MRRVTLLYLFAALAALLSPAVANAAPRMYVGFHDDPNFRYEERRAAMLDQVRSTHATIVRTLVTWPNVAPKRPANAADPFDPAYQFDDLDELVRNAQARDMEVIITLWGTPKWANGGKTPNFLPTRLSDFTAFARAVASRYSGRFPGYPYVRFFSIWNESNLQLFLAPQFDAAGKSVAPRNYAKLAAAGYSGVKAGNAGALVAIGSTSSAGRDKPLAGKSATHSPGRFAQLVAAANPRLKFDALGAAPVPGAGEPEAAAEGEVAERDAVRVPALREVARYLVQAQERPNLDHGVRPRGQAGRRGEGHLPLPAGGVRRAGPRRREEGSAGRHVHLVRLPRPHHEPVAERSPHDHAVRQSPRSDVSPPLRPRSTRATGASPSRAAESRR